VEYEERWLEGSSMLLTSSDFGIPAQKWTEAKRQARDAMIRRAKRRLTISYSDLVKEITAIQFEPYDTRLFHLLGETSKEEDAAGRGMLTAVVVHKTGDMQPGPGFYKLATEIGHAPTDPIRFWIEELNRVFATWSSTR
jgi:hypothetical protein